MDYSPFGQLITQYKFTSSATLSRLNFGFSTKFTDAEGGLLYYGHRYYDPVTGRWPSRDPIRERGGVNLYGVVGNNGVNRWDVLGLWTEIKRGGGRWAETCAEKDDTWDDLAKATDLDPSEPRKWVKGYDGSTPNSGTKYSVPNVFASYTTGFGMWSTGGKIMTDWFNGGFGILGIFRTEVNRLKMHYSTIGYKIITHDGAMSGKTFEGIWKEDGIAALAFGGHGFEDSVGFVAGTMDNADNIVTSRDVKPPYKLSLIGAYSCYSYENDWRDHLSTYGVMYEYKGVARALWNSFPMRTDHSPDVPKFPKDSGISMPFPF
jgi:RHS repeat-associated protein